MTWIVIITKPAEKELNKIPSKDFNYIRTALLRMEIDPFSGDIRRLEGMGDTIRRRVGQWRVFYDIDFSKRRVIVTSIRRRTSSTY